MIVMQKGVELKAMTMTILELQECIESLETEKTFLWQMNGGMLQKSCTTKSHPSEEKKTFIISVPYKFIFIAVLLEDMIHGWCSEEVYELR